MAVIRAAGIELLSEDKVRWPVSQQALRQADIILFNIYIFFSFK